jgi:hypothetical protein
MSAPTRRVARDQVTRGRPVEKGVQMRHDREAPQTSLSRLLFYAGPLLWAVMIVFHPNPGETARSRESETTSTAGSSSTSGSSS